MIIGWISQLFPPPNIFLFLKFGVCVCLCGLAVLCCALSLCNFPPPSPSLFLCPAFAIPNPEEQRVLVLVMLRRQRSVRGLWNIHADAHIHTKLETHTDTNYFKPFIFFSLSVCPYLQKIRKYNLSSSRFRKKKLYTCKHSHTLMSAAEAETNYAIPLNFYTIRVLQYLLYLYTLFLFLTW